MVHKKPRLLVISKVFPFPGESGQQMRIKYSVESLKNDFHITFLSTSPKAQLEEVKYKLKRFVDESIILPTKYEGKIFKTIYRFIGFIWMILTGLKFSNFIVSKVDFTLKRLESALAGKEFDIVLYEYWHTYKTIDYFKKRNVPTILDMHNILWQSYRSQLNMTLWIPSVCKDWLVKRYKKHEEFAWQCYDGLIAINKNEFNYVNGITNNSTNNIHIPMGVDLSKWSVERDPAHPPRVGYYGGLGSPHNQKDALKCYTDIMPNVWEKYPEVELWLVGSNPPNHLKELGKKDKRIHVTGYIKNVGEILKTMTVMVCPWEGTYGFRSRIIELMALGLPIVTTKEALDGMKLPKNDCVLITNDYSQYRSHITHLISDNEFNIKIGNQVKQFAHKYYSLEKSYTLFPGYIESLAKF